MFRTWQLMVLAVVACLEGPVLSIVNAQNYSSRPIATPGSSWLKKESDSIDAEIARFQRRKIDLQVRKDALSAESRRIDLMRKNVQTKAQAIVFNQIVRTFNERVDEFNYDRNRFNDDVKYVDKRIDVYNMNLVAFNKRRADASSSNFHMDENAQRRPPGSPDSLGEIEKRAKEQNKK